MTARHFQSTLDRGGDELLQLLASLNHPGIAHAHGLGLATAQGSDAPITGVQGGADPRP